jgi:aspartyl/asparaginyl-tRNA synthetase
MVKALASYETLRTYHETITALRDFFLKRGFLEVGAQSRRSILAACEDPKTISTYNFAGVKWPLPQTGQMWLEYELLMNPDVPGVFCSTTSYRDEPNPISERHLNIFPMFEFESRGDMQALQRTLEDLFEFLGFGPREQYREGDYDFIANYYGAKNDISAAQEMKIWPDFGPVFFLKNFPLGTSPFWNMKKIGNHSNKIDSILYGMETVGSAERSTDRDEMREQFHLISDGMYADILYRLFGKERVDRELDEYLSLNFFPRFGAGIGVNRMIRALTLLHGENQNWNGAWKTSGPQSRLQL